MPKPLRPRPLSPRKLTRREALSGTVHLALLSGVGAALVGCGMGRKLRCDDLHGLSDADKAQRSSSGYVDHTQDPERRCDNCDFWRARFGELACGACAVVKGPIHPGGYCTLWAVPRT